MSYSEVESWLFPEKNRVSRRLAASVADLVIGIAACLKWPQGLTSSLLGCRCFSSNKWSSSHVGSFHAILPHLWSSNSSSYISAGMYRRLPTLPRRICSRNWFEARSCSEHRKNRRGLRPAHGPCRTSSAKSKRAGSRELTNWQPNFIEHSSLCKACSFPFRQ